jgi:predicted nucleic acid-binding protein
LSYLIDTNVISETARPRPSPAVVSWLGRQAEVHLASVTLYELARGVRHVAAGRRQRFLEEWLAALLASSAVIEPFDEASALAAAAIEREARRRGRPVADRDLFILATAAAHDLGVATHDVDDFRGHGVPLYDPFDDLHVSG